MAEVEVGDVLAGKYRVERVLGEGGMGIVVAATHIALGERVAIKLMRAEAMDREDGVQRFLREARAVVKLKSEHVARVLDVATLETGAPYIVMEHLDGKDLSQMLAARGALPVAEVADFLVQACDAIAEAHTLGIIHRDLKPANLFITSGRDGLPLVKVLDFGISKVNVLGDRPESVTSSAMLLGSPAYMSPEQMKSSHDVGPTTDIWSLGVILYEAVSGRLPYLETTMGALMAKVFTEPPPLKLLEGRMPPDLVVATGRCLAKEPQDRYASVTELAVDLARFGPASSGQRVSRILAMTRASRRASVATPLSSLSPMAATQHPSILGVATTQADTLPGARSGASRRPRPIALYGAIALAGVVATTAFVRTSSVGGDHAGGASPGTSTEATSGARTQLVPAVAVDTVESQATAPSNPPSSASPLAPTVSAPVTPADAGAASSPKAPAPTGHGSPTPPVSASKSSTDGGDPFHGRY